MSYVPPFSIVKDRFTFSSEKGEVKATLGYEELIGILKLYLRSVVVDEAWYRTTYPDVADSIDEGDFVSAKHHFVENGYFEGRMPYLMSVNEDYYLESYPDIDAGIKKGLIASANDHFQEFGYNEGRLPASY